MNESNTALVIAETAIGIAGFVMSTIDWLFDTGMWFGDTQWVFFSSLVAPIPLALLWGKQWGAAFVAALSALWILPAAVGAPTNAT